MAASNFCCICPFTDHSQSPFLRIAGKEMLCFTKTRDTCEFVFKLATRNVYFFFNLDMVQKLISQSSQQLT